MRTVINISNVTVNSGETPIVTYSNPVTTLINDIPIPPRTSKVHCPCCCGCCSNNCCCNDCFSHCCCGCRCCCNNRN